MPNKKPADGQNDSSKPQGQAPEDFSWRAMRELARLALEFLATEDDLPPRDLPPAQLSERLGIALPTKGRPLQEVTNKLGRILAATPSSSSPRFVNQLFGGRNAAATLAEMLVALPDTSMYTYKVAGAQILVEQEVLARLLAAVPYGHGEGMFSPGGSLANLTAMILARNESLPGVREHGLTDQRPVVYTSTAAHYSIGKAAGILGLGRENVRPVPTDADGRMKPEALAEMISDDERSERQPLFINATAGTTVLGAIDPISRIAAVAQEHGVWLHVDGALGGSLLLSKKYRQLLAGIELADSFAWNAHKMMAVPLPCSVLLVRQRGLLAKHLGEAATYLFQTDEEDLNPGTRSLQCGRRSDALKLWAAWQLLGDDGYDAMLTRHVDLARHAARQIRSDPELELLGAPQSTNVCFEVRGRSSVAICDALDRQGILKIGHGSVGERSAIRLVCVNPDFDERRIEEILREIKAAAAALPLTEGATG